MFNIYKMCCFCMYPSDLKNEQWELIKDFFIENENVKKRGRKAWRDPRDILDGILYLNKTGCQWRQLPADFPPWRTVHHYFQKWTRSGLLDKILMTLNKKVRKEAGKNEEPSYGIIDSQSVKMQSEGEAKGVDGYKKVKGRKRHIVVDTLGCLLAVVVHAANIHDTKAAYTVMAKACQSYPTICAFSGDQGYCKTAEEDAMLLGRTMYISKKIDDKFAVLPKRWIVERTFAWMNGYRRLSKDFEKNPRFSEAMVKLSYIKLALNKLKY